MSLVEIKHFSGEQLLSEHLARMGEIDIEQMAIL